MRSRVVGAMVAAAILIGGYGAITGGGGGGGSSFSGTFDCYGTTGCSSLPAAAGCTSTISTGAGVLATAITGAAGGAVICLNAGTYGTLTSTDTKSSDVTIQPVSGAAVTVGRITLSGARHLRFTGNGGGGATMAVFGATVDTDSTNITIDHATFTSCALYDQANGSAVLFDHDSFDNLGVGMAGCTYEGRFQVTGGFTGVQQLTISNTRFSGEGLGGGGDCADGVQIEGDGVTVGPGNEFTNIFESGCGVHADPIQIIDHKAIVITGNWFHDNGDGSGGCLCYDQGPSNVTVTNNVFASTGYAYSILAGTSETGWTISHNVIFKNVAMGTDSGTGNVIRDNVWAVAGEGIVNTGVNVTHDHNINSELTPLGAGEVACTPTFSTTVASGYYHYQLDSSSPCGYLAATDGKSMGITP